MIIQSRLLPFGHRNRPGYAMKPQGILFHTTNNWSDGAGDELHGEYMKNTDRVVSWHVTVDKDSATQHIPFNENAWHAGDGRNGTYNRNWIGVEIACEAVKIGEPLDDETYINAVRVISQLMIQFGFGWDRLQPHNVVYGKNCPHNSLFDRMQFKKDVTAFMDAQKQLFIDVPVGIWYEDELKIAEQRGILTGYSDGSFRPDQPITRAEMAVVVAKLIKELE